MWPCSRSTTVFELAEGWCVYILTAEHVERFPSVTVSPSGLAAHGIHPVDGDELAEAVRAAECLPATEPPLDRH
jgi:hypothetical protein